LGGRDVKVDDIEVVCEKLLEIGKYRQVDSVYNYLGVRE